MADKIRYEIILNWSKEDEAFIAEVPELRGCAADGATYQEALANAEVIIREWIAKPHGSSDALCRSHAGG
jgi:predicted RNase H-like HicB family nuclease